MNFIVARPFRKAYSETFIDAHVRYLTKGNNEWRCPWKRYQRISGLRNTLLEAAFHFFLGLNRPEGVLAEYGPTGVSVHSACQRAGVPLAVHFHGFDAYRKDVLKAYGPGYAGLFKTARVLIAVSRPMQEQLKFLGAPPEKIIYHPYGVDTDFFKPSVGAKKEPLFLAVGRFVPKKAPLLTLQAFAIVKRIVPEAVLVMIGDGPLRRDCEAWVRRSGFQDSVRFPGPLTHREVGGWLHKARAFVQHSLTAPDGDSEGMPLAVLEAGASGVPVVSTRHGGIPEAVCHGETGYLVTEKDVEDMAKYMLLMLQNPDHAHELGAGGRRHVLANYSLIKTLENLRSLLGRVFETYPR